MVDQFVFGGPCDPERLVKKIPVEWFHYNNKWNEGVTERARVGPVGEGHAGRERVEQAKQMATKYDTVALTKSHIEQHNIINKKREKYTYNIHYNFINKKIFPESGKARNVARQEMCFS